MYHILLIKRFLENTKQNNCIWFYTHNLLNKNRMKILFYAFIFIIYPWSPRKLKFHMSKRKFSVGLKLGEWDVKPHVHHMKSSRVFVIVLLVKGYKQVKIVVRIIDFVMPDVFWLSSYRSSSVKYGLLLHGHCYFSSWMQSPLLFNKISFY